MADQPWITQFDGPDTLRTVSPYSYGPTSEMPAGYQFFNARSPWNTRVPENPIIDANSAAIINWMNTVNGQNGPIDRYTGGGQNSSDTDYPLYFAGASDPLVRVKIKAGAHDTSNANFNRHGIASTAHDMLIPMPAGALQSGGSDSILTVMSADAIAEMWQANSWTPGAGMFGCAWCVYTLLAGNGMPAMPFGCSSSGYSVHGGSIRIVDLNAGRIPHAIRINTAYVRWNTNQPPCTGAALGDPGVTPGDANDLNRPVTGSRIWWSPADSVTNALAIPAWKKTMLRALHEYGAIICDTSASGSWHWKVEDGTADQAYGHQDRWKTFAIQQGWAAVGGGDPNYIMPCSAGVDWSQLRMLSPANFAF